MSKQRPVFQMNKLTGKVIAIHSSGAEAARAIGCGSSSIYDALKLRQGRNVAKGFRWQFAEETAPTLAGAQ